MTIETTLGPTFSAIEAMVLSSLVTEELPSVAGLMSELESPLRIFWIYIPDAIPSVVKSAKAVTDTSVIMTDFRFMLFLYLMVVYRQYSMQRLSFAVKLRQFFVRPCFEGK